MVIWKAILEPIDRQEIDAPIGAEMLCAHEQMGRICIWFRCNPYAEIEKRTISMSRTGHYVSDGKYIGTVFLSGGQLVSHVFDISH